MTSHSLVFWPQYAQFVLYDVKTPYERDMVPHFDTTEEQNGHLSARRLEVSIGLLRDAEVQLELSFHESEPEPILGDWMVKVQAVLEVPSGLFGVRDIIADLDQPKWMLEVAAGKYNLRAYGRLELEDQVFTVQLWPV